MVDSMREAITGNLLTKTKKVFAKTLKRGYALMVIPNSQGTIRCFSIPYLVFLSVFVLFGINTYFLCRYPFRITEIMKLESEINSLQSIISKQDKELRRLDPYLRATQEIESDLNKANKFLVKMEKQYLEVRNRKSTEELSVRLVNLPQYKLSSTDREYSKLAVLNDNLEYLAEEISYTTSSLQDLLTRYKDYDRQLDFTPTIWPLARERSISSGFGYRRHPIYKRLIKHQGVDIPCRQGTPVRATAEGKVTIAGVRGGYGLLVEIDHGYGYRTRYGHNSRVAVRVGQWVKKGQTVAYAGNTGTSTGVHVHYEVRVNGVPVNPVPYMK